MTMFHAVMMGEDGSEFGADVEAGTRDEAESLLNEDYPESNIVQLESPSDTEERVSAMHSHILSGGDWDDEGRPFWPEGRDEDFDDEDDEDGGLD